MTKIADIFLRQGLLLLALLYSLALSAQPPAGYYDNANGQEGAALKTALYNIINAHTVKSYDDLWTAFQTTDVQANGKVWDMYSNCEFTFGDPDQCGNYSNECDCYNREHSFPQSWFGSGAPMGSDLFHIVPTDGKVNGMRSNYPFGTVASPTYTSGNGSKVGPCSYPGYSGTVFEPIDEYKGDFARNYFYMATRYENVIAGWSSPILNGTTFPSYDDWFLNMLGEWHTNDPVSDKEIDRNNAVYLIQNNRNPFIDHPEYVFEVWGVGTAPGVLPEPTNYPVAFSAHNIHLQWSDATGTTLPEGYLIRMSATGFDAITAPEDGTLYTGTTDFMVTYGAGEFRVKNLNANTTYYFKMYSFTGSGTNINYKTDGAVPQIVQTTGM